MRVTYGCTLKISGHCLAIKDQGSVSCFSRSQKTVVFGHWGVGGKARLG